MNPVNQKSAGVCILGSTGSVGQSTLDVISRNPDKFRVVALSARTSVDALYEQAAMFQPKYVAISEPTQVAGFQQRLNSLPSPPVLLVGDDALCEIARDDDVDFVMAAIVGAAGLMPTLAAAESGKRVLLANKEALVMSGSLLLEAAKRSGAILLPIDSEHNAVFQCLAGEQKENLSATVERIVLTGSGGPFRTTPIKELKTVSPDQACAHPNWEMGRKISVDSATMMNKGLEVIEASLLFSTPSKQIEVVIHPQSIIHSLVSYVDGSSLAQLGAPDMRIPIAHALAWPSRVSSGVAGLSFSELQNLEFHSVDYNRFPCLKLAFDCLAEGKTAPTVLNAANEVAVNSFLNEQVAFTDIYRINEYTCGKVEPQAVDSVEALLEIDREARMCATQYLKTLLH